jgi:hypothetical protein
MPSTPIHTLANGRRVIFPFSSKPPTKPLVEYLPPHGTKFEFELGQPFRHYWFLYSHKYPQSHILLHTYFCKDKDYGCPFHN